MPKMDGRAAARYLKQNDLTKHIPIIILTASAMGEDLEDLQSLCEGILHKPVSRSQLVCHLTKILARNQNYSSSSDRHNIVVKDTHLPPTHLENSQTNPYLIEKLRYEEENSWKNLLGTMKKREIQNFAGNLRLIAAEYQCTTLLNYVTTLEMQLAAFDWEHLPKTVEQYPQVWRSLI